MRERSGMDEQRRGRAPGEREADERSVPPFGGVELLNQRVRD